MCGEGGDFPTPLHSNGAELQPKPGIRTRTPKLGSVRQCAVLVALELGGGVPLVPGCWWRRESSTQVYLANMLLPPAVGSGISRPPQHEGASPYMVCDVTDITAMAPFLHAAVGGECQS